MLHRVDRYPLGMDHEALLRDIYAVVRMDVIEPEA
jgi:hypothetical protein